MRLCNSNLVVSSALQVDAHQGVAMSLLFTLGCVKKQQQQQPLQQHKSSFAAHGCSAGHFYTLS
jgi:hypothetical protein